MFPVEAPFAPLAPHDGTLRVHLLGLVEYAATLGLQEQNVYELSGRQDCDGILMLAEHPPCITIGREGSRAQIALDDEELQRRSLPVQWVARGGGAVVHAPGQLAISLQVPLNRLRLGLSDFRLRLESAVQATLRELRFSSRQSPDSPGLWCRSGQVAAFGGAVKSSVSCHGMFLNVSLDPRWLTLSTPLLSDSRWTSLQMQRLEPVRMPQVREALIHHIGQLFGFEQVDLATGHPSLKRVRRRVGVAS